MNHADSLHRRLSRQCRRAAGAALIRCLASIGTLLLCGVSPASWAATAPWQSTPYRVHVFIAASPQTELTPQTESQLCADLDTRIQSTLGAAWEATVSKAPASLCRAAVANIENLTAEMMPTSVFDGDKAIFVVLTPSKGGIEVTGRCFDAYTRTFSPCATRSAWQIGMLRDSAFDVTFASFAPLARIERVEKGQAALCVKGISLPTRDPTFSLLHKGDVFRPIIRSNDRSGEFRRATPVPWTFCTVESVARDGARCRVSSGLRAGLAAHGRGSSEMLALGVGPTKRPTTLILQSRSKPTQPLAGYDVYARSPTGQSAALVGRTDPQGRIVVPPSDNLLQVLLVKNGGESLARLPIVPGLEPQLIAHVANDESRLEAEGIIIGLQEELVDVVARREVLVARVHAQIEAGQLDKVRRLIDELRSLPTTEQFLLRLTSAQERLVANDAIVQRKIDALLADTHKLINQHLDPRSVDDVEREFHAAEQRREK